MGLYVPRNAPLPATAQQMFRWAQLGSQPVLFGVWVGGIVHSCATPCSRIICSVDAVRDANQVTQTIYSIALEFAHTESSLGEAALSV